MGDYEISANQLVSFVPVPEFPFPPPQAVLATAEVLDDAGALDFKPTPSPGAADVASFGLSADATLAPLLTTPEEVVA